MISHAVLASESEHIRLPIQPAMVLEDREGHHVTLVASVYSPEQRCWSYETRAGGDRARLSSLAGYRIVGSGSAEREAPPPRHLAPGVGCDDFPAVPDVTGRP
ncbi:hypothetical protein [Actinomadura roseirufa]|uniref:hypothetical protein n=1 Tax=Actinomadura roseirufa TaxID=2094049 RepID=UPI0010414966|nr:hypothetical protein [Actinomadura roseirufa]